MSADQAHERIAPEAMHEIIMTMIYELAESLCPDHPDWLPEDAQAKLETIDASLRYALRLDPHNAAAPDPATAGLLPA